MDVSLPDYSAACSTAESGNVVGLVRTLLAQLVRSADAEQVFGSLAQAYSSHSGADCVVKWSAASDTENCLLSDGADLATGPDWVAVRIRTEALGTSEASLAAAARAAVAEAPVESTPEPLTGCVVCRRPGSAVTPAEVEALRLVVDFAAGVVHDERSVARVEGAARNLRVALAGNREIGTAIGIVMSSYLVPENEAFALLCQTAQQQNRKLREVATEVIQTGALTSASMGTQTANGASGAIPENERGTA